MKRMQKFEKITDYLFETTYDEYEQFFEEARVKLLKYHPYMGGCSSVQRGSIRGRNYDWTYDEEPEFIVHVPANDKGRHASVGVAVLTEITAADVENGQREDAYRTIPYYTLDGINDAGLCVNINVVGYKEKGEFEMKTEGFGDDICPVMVTRILLDGAGSIDEAVAMIDGMDIFSLGTVEEAHFMISGPQSAKDSTYNTVVVGLVPDESRHYRVSVIDYNNGDFVDNKPIMTNFHLTGFDGSIESLTRHLMGYERYLILQENYEHGNSMEGMMDLMKQVHYSKAYDLDSDNFWYSDFAEGELDMTNRGESKLCGDLSRAGAYEEILGKAVGHFNRMERDATIWRTVHTSVYDTDRKVLHIMPQESGKTYKFYLEG